MIYKLTWENNLVAVGIAQAVLFVLATMEIYVLAILVLKHTWMAFLIGLIVGTNIILISYIKPIMAEGLSLWLVSTLALAVVYYVRTVRIRAFWLIVLCLIALIFTRPEWLYFPVLLFAFLLLAALRRAAGRRFLLNALLALVCIYGLVAAYIVVNAEMNQYPGLSMVENYNWLGKILQFNMQDEAPRQYAQESRQIDVLNAHRNRSPYYVLQYMPTLAKDHAQPAGEFARTIILHHPVEFFVDTIPTILPSLTHFYDAQPIEPNAPFHLSISLLLSFDRLLYRANALFLLCIPLWLCLFCWRKLRSLPLVMQMGAIILLAFYALMITDLGGYKYEDYMRVHIVFDPLLIFAVWGSVFLGAQLLYRRVVNFN